MGSRIPFNERRSQENIITNMSPKIKARLRLIHNVTYHCLKPRGKDLSKNLGNHRTTRDRPELLNLRSISNFGNKSNRIDISRGNIIPEQKKSLIASQTSNLTICQAFLKKEKVKDI